MRRRRIVLFFMALFVVVLLLPSLLVLEKREDTEQIGKRPNEKLTDTVPLSMNVKVFREQLGVTEEVPIEDYVRGVVASEMPASFELEALKAQALTARTFIIRILTEQKEGTVEGSAHVTDTVMHQVYHNDEELQALWKNDYDWKMKKITQAVEETKGQILTYNNEPITASFFSTSNGYTENSEDYWGGDYPYLKSVESPWDKKAPNYETIVSIPISTFEQSLGVKVTDDFSFTVVKRTKGNRIGEVEIGGKTFTGREIREKLNLRSSDFLWEKQGDSIEITTKGYGHGVGMSQFGANGMAQEGRSYDQIAKHYYQNVEIVTAEPFVAKISKK
ncbi:MAG TPA: stage II sporulation protein D [Massilibacterium sp.]|nr:stage II sporulation protein D [Massilibacterium sp.]